MLHYGYQLPPLLKIQPKPRTVTIVQNGQYKAVLLFYLVALRQEGIEPIMLADTATQGH